MSKLGWALRVVDFCKSQKADYHAVIGTMARTNAYRMARQKFIKNAAWQEVHDLLEMALAAAKQAD